MRKRSLLPMDAMAASAAPQLASTSSGLQPTSIDMVPAGSSFPSRPAASTATSTPPVEVSSPPPHSGGVHVDELGPKTVLAAGTSYLCVPRLRRSSSVPARLRLQNCSELGVDGAAGARSPKLSPTASEILLAEGNACGAWQEVVRRHSLRRPAALPRRSIPAWLFGRCCRCLAHGHRANVCTDPLCCSCCLENGHRARECRNPWRPLSSMACLVASLLSRSSVNPCHA
jgi:hypothetical protein